VPFGIGIPQCEGERINRPQSAHARARNVVAADLTADTEKKSRKPGRAAALQAIWGSSARPCPGERPPPAGVRPSRRTIMETGAVLAFILLAALIAATVMWSMRRKDRGIEQARDRATEHIYDEAERQDRREQP
jgi:hypothetical protein